MAASGGEAKGQAKPNRELRRAIAHKGYSIASFAKEVGVSTRTVDNWLKGTRQPYPAHRRKSADKLDMPADILWPDAFTPFDDDQSEDSDLADESDASGPSTVHLPDTADLTAVYLSRPEFLHAHTPDRLFGNAASIDLSGLSLNLLCQQYPDTEISRLLQSGTAIRCLFLDPGGRYIREREVEEEGHSPGLLADLTRVNMNTLQRIRDRLPEAAAANLHIRTYDEPIRFNIAVIDNATCIVQPYLPRARGVESPTLVIEKRDQAAGLFAVFSTVFDYLWERGQPYTP
ncbi:XRE family transcriptional regulator [Mycobacteroides abscessus subsp. massiliense]|uniref:DUF5919 domain-containing protein n=1 Tax=Mycobacteroides abscessus TaxID=36809 RepID=UPI0009A690DE|nr:DUF5919 domain-containing protein [Mycobacteroides abscessus]SKU49569.1 XRE family transcriptional regulator [Mycobacteroides abscessus subsp. massiliense]SKV03479.1 XRE family transcriptional regulator [Mycobacteroides abscessus subsp. massiliense]